MGNKKHTRIMGHFEQPSHGSRTEKPKQCKHCGRPVRETVGKSGYCKKCIAEAKGELGNEG